MPAVVLETTLHEVEVELILFVLLAQLLKERLPRVLLLLHRPLHHLLHLRLLADGHLVDELLVMQTFEHESSDNLVKHLPCQPAAQHPRLDERVFHQSLEIQEDRVVVDGAREVHLHIGLKLEHVAIGNKAFEHRQIVSRRKPRYIHKQLSLLQLLHVLPGVGNFREQVLDELVHLLLIGLRHEDIAVNSVSPLTNLRAQLLQLLVEVTT